MDQDKVPDSFDHQQPDVPTLAVDPDPDAVTDEGQKPGKYPAAGVEEDRPAPRAGSADTADTADTADGDDGARTTASG